MQDRNAVASDVPERWLRPAQVAEIIGVSVDILGRWRMQSVGPRWSKLGARIVVYALSDVREWVEANMRQTADSPTVAA